MKWFWIRTECISHSQLFTLPFNFIVFYLDPNVPPSSSFIRCDCVSPHIVTIMHEHMFKRGIAILTEMYTVQTNARSHLFYALFDICFYFQISIMCAVCNSRIRSMCICAIIGSHLWAYGPFVLCPSRKKCVFYFVLPG